MKKVIFVIAMLAAYFVAQAQTVTLPTMAGAANDINASYQYVPTDYTLTNTTVRNFVFTAPQHNACTQDYVIKLDSVSGTHTNVAVALYGQKSPIKGDWTQIGSTVNWVGVSKPSLDTVIIISNATANRYRYYKAVVTGTGTGASKIAVQELKLFR